MKQRQVLPKVLAGALVRAAPGMTVINRANAKRPLDVFRFLSREIGPGIMQFIPLVEPKVFATVAPYHRDPATLPTVGSPQARPGTPDSFVTDWSVDPDDFGDFLCKMLDDRYNRDRGKRFVDLFESFVAVRMGLPPQICVFHDLCGKVLLMERDGSLYSCDHLVYSEYRLGNVKDQSLVNTVFCHRQVKFGSDKSDSLPRHCRVCPYLSLCWGECPRHRFVKTPGGEPRLNYLCPGLTRFVGHADARLMPSLQRLIQVPPLRLDLLSLRNAQHASRPAATSPPYLPWGRSGPPASRICGRCCSASPNQ